MIFVTVGHQMPFDRLIKAVDRWSRETQQTEVIAQIGDTRFVPEHISWVKTLTPDSFRDHMERADLIIAHAGTGTILTALEISKPLLVMPRRASLSETRNDHQVATAKRFLEMGRVHVAMDELELPEKLDQLASMRSGGTISSQASPMLISALRAFIHRTDDLAGTDLDGSKISDAPHQTPHPDT